MPPRTAQTFQADNKAHARKTLVMRIVIGVVVLGLAYGAYALFSGPSVKIPKGWVRPEPRADHSRIIVAFGDSLTAGYTLPIEDSYPSQLQRLLSEKGYTPYTVINKGVSGDTTADALLRLPEVLAEKPEIVILVLGANDGLQSLSPTEAKKRLAYMIESLQKDGSLVILAGMRAPIGRPAEYIKEFEGMYPALAERYQVPLIPFFLKGVVLRPSLTIQDRLHPNKEGYAYVVNETLWPYLKPLLVEPCRSYHDCFK
jgi:acyl-CoA thioesterase-1